MSKEYKVVVEGGGRNLYKITEYNGKYHAYQVTVNLFSNDNDSIGKASSLEVALSGLQGQTCTIDIDSKRGRWQGITYAKAMENPICRSEVSPDPAREWGAGGIFMQ